MILFFCRGIDTALTGYIQWWIVVDNCLIPGISGVPDNVLLEGNTLKNCNVMPILPQQNKKIVCCKTLCFGLCIWYTVYLPVHKAYEKQNTADYEAEVNIISQMCSEHDSHYCTQNIMWHAHKTQYFKLQVTYCLDYWLVGLNWWSVV